MSQILVDGQGAEISIAPGGSLTVFTINGTFSARALTGDIAGTTLASASSTDGQTFGPYTNGMSILLTAGLNSKVVYDVGTTPSFLPAEVSTDVYVLAQSAVPVILPSSGSSNATGQITHTTALPYQPSGVVQIWLPSGVVTAGSQGTGAKLYSVIYSSTTVCQIQGTGIVTANAAYTQTTASDLTLATIVVPGGAMGANGAIRIDNITANPNNANNKTINNILNASAVLQLVTTTAVSARSSVMTRNRGVQNSQITSQIGTTNAGTVPIYTSVDTSATQNLTLTGQLAVATDYIILEGYTVELLPRA